MTQLDEELVQQVDQLGSTPWSGTTYRYTTARRDPLSGAGARLFGGRWNPSDIFATIYLGTPLKACLGELERLAESQGVSATELLEAPYKLHTIEASNLSVLDLRTDVALVQVGLTSADIVDPDWTACQSVGHAAWFLGLDGLLAPSASGEGLVLAAFESRVGTSLQVAAAEVLTPTLLQQLLQNSDSDSD